MLELLTLVVAILVFRIYERIAWLTGAMESHSAIMLKLEAARGVGAPGDIKLVWWDPSIEPFPTSAKHNEPVDLTTIYWGLPPRLRANKPTARDRLLHLWELFAYGPSGR